MIRFASCQAPNAETQFAAIAQYLGKQLGQDVEVVDTKDWQAREAGLFGGEIQVGWVCGLPYALEADRPGSQIELLAAPVMAAARYHGRSVYFSDVVVRRDSEFQSFDALAGVRWAYNEPHSHSGYNITCYMLAMKGLTADFFAGRIAAGSHERALRLLLRGRIDATALDTTVLETELRKRPELASQFRVLEVWGPSPIPPWIIHRSVPEGLRKDLRAALVAMHKTPIGQSVLQGFEIQRFVEVSDRDYDGIRQMYTIAQPIRL